MRRLLNWFRRSRLETDLDRELRHHIECRVRDLTQAGVPEADARRDAARELGGLAQVREAIRDEWLTRGVRDFAYDLRFSARSFLRSPSFTATAIVSLALGIGSTTAIYSLVDQLILRALPVREPNRLVLVDWKGDQVATGFGTYNLMSYPICRDLQQHTEVFDGVLCRALLRVRLSVGSEHTPVVSELVSGTYFSTLGVEPAVGRMLGPEDDRPGDPSPVVVLGHDFWRTQLASDPEIVGRKVLINQFPMTVVGVAAQGFRGVDVGEVPSLWIPAPMIAQLIPGFTNLLDRRTRWMQIVGRLKSSETAAQGQAALQPWFKAMLDEDMRRPGFPKVTAQRRQRFLASTIALTPAPQGHSSLRRRLSQPLWVLLAATAVLLGLACLNVAGLFLARGSAQDREISTRLALGASRGRIGRQLLADSVLLALSGGLLGLAVAPAAIQGLIAFLPRDAAPHALHASVDGRVLLFAFGVSLVAGLASGVVPALQAGRRSLVSPLRERGGTGGGVRLRKVIVAAQIALSLILVVGAVLFARTLTGLLAKGPGFSTASLVSFGVDMLGYSPEASGRLVRRIHEGIRASASVESAAVARYPLLTGGSWNNQMTIQADRRLTTDREVNLNAISTEFFATLGIPIVAGRNFNERDAGSSQESGPRVAIVNEALVRRYLRGTSPLGARIGVGSGLDVKPEIEVVGVVADFSYRGIREESEQAYFPMDEESESGGTFYVKVRGIPEQAVPAIRAIVRNADPTVPIGSLRTADDQVRRSLNTERILATLSSAFGVLALLLSLIGLYGVMSFVAAQRTREIGIRIALGAQRRSALWLMLRDAIVVIAAGVAVALPCIRLLGRLVESQLFGITPMDPSTIAAATLLLALSAIAAALIPAAAASRLNPTDALRAE